MDRGAAVYILRLILQRIIGILLFFAGSSWICDRRTGIYFSLYLIIGILSGSIMYKVNPETIRERGKIRTDSPVWDKILLTVYWLLAYFIIYLIAGLEYEKISSIDVRYCIGILFYIAATVITLQAMVMNTYLESTARIQRDRNQKVVQSGVYRIIRHPTYLAILIFCIAVSLIFPSLFVAITAAVIAVITVIRTYLEDSMLVKGLDGYRDYANRVRYRLIPFVW
ncbi:isoprenylcysteine carboxylmethyltransferase family protein [Ruminococcus sp. OA3]|uniref:methyltransferase family protein n=1 Tax=Ruminococcus sp. OA3 TaxID=2914164 RepID=UPI001F070E5F|nr:isoprenylcysteine carboxylmethyltransferase family protein [Ruminococcus sp. OA3]MCH1984366.1 isoprenylcysteine carboxylmethyltransferase family protein [Ruminococcus sp. OA3]